MLYNATLLAYLRIKGRAKRSSVLANTTHPAAEFDALHNLGKLGLNLAHGVHTAHPLQVLLTSLVAQFKLSRFHFAKTYRALTGHAPVQEFIQLEMAHACRLLDEVEQGIRQVAEQQGCDDVYYYSRLFRKVVGMAPSHYRALHQG